MTNDLGSAQSLLTSPSLLAESASPIKSDVRCRLAVTYQRSASRPKSALRLKPRSREGVLSYPASARFKVRHARCVGIPSVFVTPYNQNARQAVPFHHCQRLAQLPGTSLLQHFYGDRADLGTIFPSGRQRSILRLCLPVGRSFLGIRIQAGRTGKLHRLAHPRYAILSCFSAMPCNAKFGVCILR